MQNVKISAYLKSVTLLLVVVVVAAALVKVVVVIVVVVVVVVVVFAKKQNMKRIQIVLNNITMYNSKSLLTDISTSDMWSAYLTAH